MGGDHTGRTRVQLVEQGEVKVPLTPSQSLVILLETEIKVPQQLVLHCRRSSVRLQATQEITLMKSMTKASP